MTRDGLTEENLRDGSVKDISHRSRGRPENKEEFVPERERKKAENEDLRIFSICSRFPFPDFESSFSAFLRCRSGTNYSIFSGRPRHQ